MFSAVPRPVAEGRESVREDVAAFSAAERPLQIVIFHCILKNGIHVLIPPDFWSRHASAKQQKYTKLHFSC